MKNTLIRALGAGVVAAAGLTLLPATAAQAAPVTDATLTAKTNAYNYTPECTTTNFDKTTTTPLPVDGRSVQQSVENVSTVSKTGGGGPTTTATQTASGRGRATVRAGQLATFDLSGKGRVDIAVPAGQTCGISARATVKQTLTFVLDKPQWVSVTATQGADTEAWIVGELQGGDTYFEIDSGVTGGASSSTWYLVPGTYYLEAGLSWYHYAPVGASSGSGYGSGALHLELHDVGGAYAPTSGAAKKYVALGNQVTCASKTVPVTFGSRVKVAKFYVDGHKVRTVTKPRKHATTTVPGVGGTQARKVRVQLVVDPPGRRTKQTVTATRTYRACSAAH